MKAQQLEPNEGEISEECTETECHTLAEIPLSPNVSHPSKPYKKKIGSYSYYLNAVIGHGFSSVVYKGAYNNDRSQKVAMKVIALNGMSKHRRLLLENQVNILKKLKHPNIVNLLDFYFTKNNCYIVTEYCQGGSLQNRIDENISFQWTRVAYQIGAACQYLASLRLMHRDIKPANVFICGENFKLGDFGFACQLGLDNDFLVEKYLIGSPLFMSPEALEKSIYSLKGDAFAFGVFLYYIATSHFPWRGRDKHQLIKQYSKKKLNLQSLHSLPPKLKHYISGLLSLDCQTRLSICDLDLEILHRIKHVAKIQEKIVKLGSSYQNQLKLCEFIHLLMTNLNNWTKLNSFLPLMMSQHLGQLTEVFKWHIHPHMNELKQNYQLPVGQYVFSSDEYHWLNNCLKYVIFTLHSAPPEACIDGLMLKLLQYQQIIEHLMYKQVQETSVLIQSLTLHESFESLRPQSSQILDLLCRIDFIQL